MTNPLVPDVDTLGNLRPIQKVVFSLGSNRGDSLEHLQGAVNLVHVGQAEAHARGVLRVLDERLQSLTRLLQGFPDLAFDPLQGDIIMPITHSHSTHKLGLIPCG